MNGTNGQETERYDDEIDENAEDVDVMDVPVKSDAQELNELYLRTLADFDNYRKRTERERVEIGANAKRDLLLGIIEIAENFERAFGAASAESDASAVVEGIAVIHRQLARLLAQNGVEPFVSVGEKFDPERHEAVAVADVPGAESDAVVAELRRGYTQNGRLFVPAKVQVAR